MQGALIAQGLKARAEVCAEPHLGGLHINGHFFVGMCGGYEGEGLLWHFVEQGYGPRKRR